MYQAGATAPAVAEAHDLGVSNVYRRARQEGWRKRDLPDEPPTPPAEADPEEDAVVDVRGVARAAIGQALKLVRLGQFARASEAARAAEMIGRLVALLPEPAMADATDEAAVLDALRRKILALGQTQEQTPQQTPGQTWGEAAEPVADGPGG